MYVPSIHARATNVELTPEQRLLIYQKLSSLVRWLPKEDSEAVIDVVLRAVGDGEKGRRQYCLSVKVHTSTKTIVAVAIEPYLSLALNRARDTLRKSLIKGVNSLEFAVQRARRVRALRRGRLVVTPHLE